MKHVILYFLILLSFPYYLKSQELKPLTDSTGGIGVLEQYAFLGENYSSYGSYSDEMADKDLAVFIAGYKKGSYEIVYKGKLYFVSESKLATHPDTKNIILSWDAERQDSFRQNALGLGMQIHLEKLEGALKWLKGTSTTGLAIYKRQVYDESEYTEGTGIEFEFLNTSKKTIKYITFSFTGYNAVDDRVITGGSAMKTRKGIGPIVPEEGGSYKFEYVWHTDIVEYARLNSIKIQYMDGTIKTLSQQTISKLIIPEEYRDL